ncbi:15708_t:CDS:2 [Funneliformis caledonium]|uniref:15708_t:CDS:1 n=1 Tax=Funneliformis caledonium TaxID=1117310 RepID=A0A9N8WR49_9GLOM|nr:15708_t:CDS:2 [Funneliformis caledonium]
MSSMFEIKLGEPRPKTSWVWPYFEVKTLQDGESVATCNICNKTFKHGGSTSNLINHLAKTHKVFKPDNTSSNGGTNNNNKRGSYSSVSGLNELAANNFGGGFGSNINNIYDFHQQNYQILQPQYNLEEEMLHPHHHHIDGANMRKSKQQKLNHPLDFLFGTWYGEGSGRFEGINDFIYNEEITIYPDEAGRGWLYYRQKTWNPMKNNSNFHSEMGYIRTPGMSDKVELVLAQPTGTFRLFQITGKKKES